MPAVFVHGLGQTPDSWTETLAHLPVEAPRRPDLPGLMRGRACVYGDLYRAFAAFCREQGGPQDLCGLSLGAVLALHYAVENPGGVRSLVLIGGQYRMPRRLLRFQNAVFRLMPEAAFREMGFSKADVLRLTASMAELDFTADLRGVACPALVVCGERDRANRRASGELAERLPRGTLRMIAGAGHALNQEAPGALAEAIGDFYGSL